ncbi:MAG: class I SAM-dependent methyltransferase [Chloroflexota bacterium]
MSSPRHTNQQYLKNEQYNSASNLSARIRLHQDYGMHPERSLMAWQFDHILQHVSDTANVLEVGTGRGDLWHENEARIPAGWDMTLTDLSAGMLEDNRKLLGSLAERMQYDVVDAMQIPYADNSFDVVFANYMLYHVPDREQTLREIRRVLKPDGVLFACTNGDNHMGMIYVLAGQVDEVTAWETVFKRTFSLQNGTAQLMPHFSDIRMVQFHNDLWVTDIQPIIDYIASMVSLDGKNIVANHEAEMRKDIDARIARDEGILIKKETGLFIAQGAFDSE